MLTAALFLVGFVILVKGADFLIDGARSVARAVGVSPWVIGLTIVGIGTSIPELSIALFANFVGEADIALGTIFGSNTYNLLIIGGLAAAISPLVMEKKWVAIDLVINIAAVLLVAIIGYDGITRLEAGILLALMVGWVIFITRAEKDVKPADGESSRVLTLPIAILLIVAGVAGVYLGGRWIVDGAVAFARFAGVSEALISLTAVAIGTSLPELSVSLRAAARGNAAIAVGNIIGSNIFDFLGIVGIMGLVRPFTVSGFLITDVLVTFSATILVLLFALFGKKYIISRKEGILMAALYLVYFVFLFVRG